MNLETLNARNSATIAALTSASGPISIPQHPYHGYFDVNLFECPPFLMFTNNDCPRAWDILFHRSFEPQSMRIWCRLAKSATGILDIGAHVGVYSLCAAALRKDITIHAFEPNPHAYSRLRVHKMVNGFDNIAEHHYAVGNDNRYVDFSWALKPTRQISSGGGIGKRTESNAERIVVAMQMLDGTGLAPTLGKNALVKIDVEGAEEFTIRGMTEVLQLRPDIIIESFSEPACNYINSVVQPLGYRAFIIHEKGGKMVLRRGL
jgi:FkbM family methyltransferase